MFIYYSIKEIDIIIDNDMWILIFIKLIINKGGSAKAQWRYEEMAFILS